MDQVKRYNAYLLTHDLGEDLKFFEFTLDEIDSPKLADDLVCLCSKHLKIDPIRRHVFGLYSREHKLWLAPNHILKDNLKILKQLEFRIRFIPFNYQALRSYYDGKDGYTMPKANKIESASNYFFFQVRHDFLKIKQDKIKGGRILGVMVTDMARYALEHNLNYERAVDQFNLSDFLPPRFRERFPSKAISFFKGKDIKRSLGHVMNKPNQNISFLKEQYVESVIGGPDDTPIMDNYGIEKYEAEIEGFSNGKKTLRKVEVSLFPNKEAGLAFRYLSRSSKNHENDWKTICSISELCFISIHSLTVEITRKCGSPRMLVFANEYLMKSFASLLDGYYRLSEKWAFSLCKEVSSPHLEYLRSIKSHGPVNFAFSKEKFQSKDFIQPGTYILRESDSTFGEYFVDIYIEEKNLKTLKIITLSSGKFEINCEPKIQINSLNEIPRFLSAHNKSTLTYCIPPSEYDCLPLLLLCACPYTDGALDAETIWPLVVPNGFFDTFKHVHNKNGRFTVRIVEGKLKKDSAVTSYALRVIRNKEDYPLALKRANDWTAVKSEIIVKLHGVICSPLQLIFEYVPFGPLDEFLYGKEKEITRPTLLEISTQAAKALFYLDELKMVHGRIRCHQFLVYSQKPRSIKIKLSDSFGNFNVLDELAWYPPEFDVTKKCKITSLVDVWAFGTTVWEIFSYGLKPENFHVVKLKQPLMCGDDIWELIEECRIYNEEFRKKPQAILRDLHHRLYTNYSTVDSEGYQYTQNEEVLKPSITRAKSERGGSFLSKFLNASKLSLRFTSVPDPWIIDSSQLIFDKRGKLLGEGYYGEVLKATMSIVVGLNETVAVKRMKATMSGEAAMEDMLSEIKIMTQLRHKNIVEIKGFVQEPQLMIVMEFVKFGSLVNWLRNHKTNVSLGKKPTRTLPLLKYASDVCAGMHYLEYKKILHRDLAARNILVASETHVQISDFGLARSLTSHQDTYSIRNRNRNLPVKWYAPESLRDSRFTHKSDVWSFGITLWEIYSYGDELAYEGLEDPKSLLCNLLAQLERGVRLPMPEQCPPILYDIMSKCWNENPDNRPSFSKLNTQFGQLIKENEDLNAK